jgi:hypothetical protein
VFAAALPVSSLVYVRSTAGTAPLRFGDAVSRWYLAEVIVKESREFYTVQPHTCAEGSHLNAVQQVKKSDIYML